MNESQRLERADRVKRWLASDEWTGAWAAVRATYIEIVETGTDEQAMDARRMLRAANTARKHLEAFVSDGALTAADIAARRSRMQI